MKRKNEIGTRPHYVVYDETEKRLVQHVKNLRTITAFWNEKGFLNKWGRAYFEWFINFIVPDLIQFNPKNKKKLALETVKIIEKFNLKTFYKHSKLEVKEKTKRLYKMAR